MEEEYKLAQPPDGGLPIYIPTYYTTSEIYELISIIDHSTTGFPNTVKKVSGILKTKMMFFEEKH